MGTTGGKLLTHTILFLAGFKFRILFIIVSQISNSVVQMSFFVTFYFLPSWLFSNFLLRTGIREFCCRLCNYKGVTQSDLNRHMKSQIHLLKSRNECTRCGEGFVTTKNLEKHVSAGCSGHHKMDIEDE